MTLLYINAIGVKSSTKNITSCLIPLNEITSATVGFLTSRAKVVYNWLQLCVVR